MTPPDGWHIHERGEPQAKPRRRRFGAPARPPLLVRLRRAVRQWLPSVVTAVLLGIAGGLTYEYLTSKGWALDTVVGHIVAGGTAYEHLSRKDWPPETMDRHIAAARNCDAARAVGLAPAYRGQPGYYPQHDRDKDGIACEPWPPQRWRRGY